MDLLHLLSDAHSASHPTGGWVYGTRDTYAAHMYLGDGMNGMNTMYYLLSLVTDDSIANGGVGRLLVVRSSALHLMAEHRH